MSGPYSEQIVARQPALAFQFHFNIHSAAPVGAHRTFCNNMKRSYKILVVLSVCVGSIPVALYGVGYRLYRVPGQAMAPTIPPNSFVIGKISTSSWPEIRRFDLVVYRDPQNRDALRIMRVVGLPGEVVAMPPEGVTVDGDLLSLPVSMELEEVGRSEHNLSQWQRGVRVSRRSIFVLGDNPKHSRDSRFVGPISLNDVVGKVVSPDNAKWPVKPAQP